MSGTITCRWTGRDGIVTTEETSAVTKHLTRTNQASTPTWSKTRNTGMAVKIDTLQASFEKGSA